jgi:hypothetical protein
MEGGKGQGSVRLREEEEDPPMLQTGHSSLDFFDKLILINVILT